MINIIDIPNLTTLSIGNGSFGNSTSFHLSNLDLLQSLNIENGMYNEVSSFKIDGLKSLKSLTIGSNSFTGMKNGFGNDIDRKMDLEMILVNHSTY